MRFGGINKFGHYDKTIERYWINIINLKGMILKDINGTIAE